MKPHSTQYITINTKYLFRLYVVNNKSNIKKKIWKTVAGKTATPTIFQFIMYQFTNFHPTFVQSCFFNGTNFQLVLNFQLYKFSTNFLSIDTFCQQCEFSMVQIFNGIICPWTFFQLVQFFNELFFNALIFNDFFLNWFKFSTFF